MSPARIQEDGAGRAALLAWLSASVFYFYQYVMRAAPAVMVPQLTQAFGVTAGGLTALVGIYYYGYAPFSLVAGLAMDQLGPRKVVPLAAALAGCGCLMFATGDKTIATAGVFLQGAAGIFSIVGAAYIATTSFPASRAATLLGATQMIGMAGGSAGQFLVGPLIAQGLAWNHFWLLLGAAGLPLAVLIFFITPSRPAARAEATQASGGWARWAASAVVTVSRNPQSILCGLIAGLMFVPTTIFSLVWGVRFLQESHDMPYMVAVLRSASVPVGWMIGSPLLGALSDRIGRRKPVIIGAAAVLLVCILLILFAPADAFPPYSLGLAVGIASGAGMIPYTVIKEANRPEHTGASTGVISFLNFMLSALLGPIFGELLTRASAGGERELGHYQTAFQPLAYGAALAIVFTLFLRETGPAARTAAAPTAQPAGTL
jgi:MFS family permease